MKVHESKFRSKLLKVRQTSAFYKHMINEHGEVDIEGKPIDDFFEVNILKACTKKIWQDWLMNVLT